MSAGQSHTVQVPIGYRVGDWEVREPIASGAFATVYEGHRIAGDSPRTAALKFLPTRGRTSRHLCHLRELAEREVEFLSRLTSPWLLRMYDTLIVDDPGHPGIDGATVLVLEKAEGSLDAVPAPADPGPLLAQICAGLAHLHRAGWVHGDLKPANVLLMHDGSVRLADFNLAAETEGPHAYVPAFATPDYTPPELLWPEVDERGARVRPSADVWAFGVLAHTVLTGAFPLPGGTTEERCDAAIRHARGAEKLRLAPQLPDEWREIIRACLAPTPAERVGAEALVARVEAAAGIARSSRPPRSSWRRLLVQAGALASALLIVTGHGAAAYIAHRHATAIDGNPVYLPRPVGSPAITRMSPHMDHRRPS